MKFNGGLVNSCPTVKDVKHRGSPVALCLDAPAHVSAAQERAHTMLNRYGVVINDDLKFAGERLKIVSQGKVEIDCDFEGDITGIEVVVSERGKVTGNVAGERVIVLGRIIGGIRGKTVALLASAHVEGDIQHTSLAIEEGAEFVGRCRLSAA
jgi:cytoskeletal protein CcmA (bactofilin family)